MYIHAQLDENGVCIGFGILKDIVVGNVVYLPDGWDEDLRWRKYENGAWSAEKFSPPPPGPSEIDSLKERLATAEQGAADNSLTTQQLIETLIDLGVI